MSVTTAELREAGMISRLDDYFADFIVRLADGRAGGVAPTWNHDGGACEEDVATSAEPVVRAREDGVASSARPAVRADEDDQVLLALAAAMASAHTAGGHVCLPLAELAGQPVLPKIQMPGPSREAGRNPLSGRTWPSLERWRQAVAASAVTGTGTPPTPLVLDEANRLYLHRYWEHEQRVIRFLGECVREDAAEVDEVWLKEALKRLFPEDVRVGGGAADAAAVEWRKLAALVTLSRRLSIISGGPGTGKTTAVIKLLALLIEQAQKAGRELRIALVAPTGKAAARLEESVEQQRGTLPIPEAVRAVLPEDASTIHRRLGAYGRGFRYNRQNRLPYDVVVVDEASMVDVVLFSRLVAALENDTRLILLGDRDQLASVQAGAVLGDLCRLGAAEPYSDEVVAGLLRIGGGDLTQTDRAVGAPGQTPSPMGAPGQAPAPMGAPGQAPSATDAPSGLGDHVVHLRRNFRFSQTSGIGAVAAAIVAGDSGGALEALGDPREKSVCWMEPASGDEIATLVPPLAVEGFGEYLQAQTVETALEAFLQFRILCAHRRGEAGVEQLNPAIEDALAAAGLCPRGRKWYRGRPVMVTRNEHALRLYNGDVGLTWPDGDGVLLVHFPDGQGGFRTFPPTRLPEFETVYAMTVHKSQGSEFGRVLLVFPQEASAILTRELLYTGVTRARHAVTVLGRRDVITHAVATPVERGSGLVDGLRR